MYYCYLSVVSIFFYWLLILTYFLFYIGYDSRVFLMATPVISNNIIIVFFTFNDITFSR